MIALSSDKVALDFTNVADEVVVNLGAYGTEVAVCIEIEATNGTCFEDGEIRAVSAHARTLMFDQSGFEEG